MEGIGKLVKIALNNHYHNISGKLNGKMRDDKGTEFWGFEISFVPEVAPMAHELYVISKLY